MLKGLRNGWSAIWLNHDYGLYLSGQMTSSLGNSIHFIAIMTLVYQATGSTLALSSLWLSFSLPVIFLGPVAGTVIDRYWSLRGWMIAADLVRAGLVAALALMPFSYISFFPAYLLITVAEVFFNAAKPAAIPNLVQPDSLLKANSNIRVGLSAMRLVGPAFAGVMVGTVGVQAVLLIDAGTFLISAGTLAFIDRAKLSRKSPAKEMQEKPNEGFVKSMVAGLKTIWVTPVLLGIGGFAFLRDMVQGGTNIMLLPMVERYFSAQVYGWTLSAFALGGLIGGVVAGRVPGAWMARAFGLSCLLGGLAQIGFGWSSNVGFLLVFGGMTTVAITVQGIVAQTCMQQATPEDARGRVFSTLDSAREGVFLLSTSVAGWIGEAVGLRTFFYVDGVVLALGCLLLLSPAFTRSFRQSVPTTA